ncbi:MAG TPA: hypothetical protein VJV03_10545 [Pyrinomonadaceae bacterium]|nr:hypothetical protein [Pyrinomonadaceae bacterium]
MKTEITEIIANLVVEEDPEVRERLDYQDEALTESVCINPIIGRWIEENDVKYLLASLNLPDHDFAKKFPAMASVSGHLRGKLIGTFETHLQHCKHCSLKTGYDLELDARIKQSCLAHSGRLLQHLKEEKSEAVDEDGHGNVGFEEIVWA